jgi:hypothetical protein
MAYGVPMLLIALVRRVSRRMLEKPWFGVAATRANSALAVEEGFAAASPCRRLTSWNRSVDTASKVSSNNGLEAESRSDMAVRVGQGEVLLYLYSSFLRRRDYVYIREEVDEVAHAADVGLHGALGRCAFGPALVQLLPQMEDFGRQSRLVYIDDPPPRLLGGLACADGAAFRLGYGEENVPQDALLVLLPLALSVTTAATVGEIPSVRWANSP